MSRGARFRLTVWMCAIGMALVPLCAFAAEGNAPATGNVPAAAGVPAASSSSASPLSAAEAVLVAGAEKGDARAKMELGLRYLMGRGVAADDIKAQDWFKKAALEGNTVAQVSLASLMAFESDVQDAPGAAVWFGKAAAQGNTQAQAELARMLETGLGVSRNPEEAKQWREEAREQANRVMLGWTWKIAATGSEKWQVAASGQAAAQKGIATGIVTPDHAGISVDVKAVGRAVERGSLQAKTVGALLLATGNGVEKDEALAVEWFREAAKVGYPQAQAVLGELYMLGWGPLEADNVRAAYWMKSAAMQGLPEAKTSYGSMLAGGKGVTENKKEAFGWIRSAAQWGEARAQVMMAMNALSRDDREGAAEWFYRAAENGDDEVLSLLGVLYGRGDGVIAGESEKMTEVRRYAQRGEPEAQLMLGLLYEEGWGASRDVVQAEQWFTAAALQHYPDVLLPLGLFYAETDRTDLAAGVFAEAAKQKAFSFARDREILQLLFIETEKMPELGESFRQGDAASGKSAPAGGADEHAGAAGGSGKAGNTGAVLPGPAAPAVSDPRRERIAKKRAFLKAQVALGNPAAEMIMATLLEEGWSVQADAEMARTLRERVRETLCAASGDAVPDEPECLPPEEDGRADGGEAGNGEAEDGQEGDGGNRLSDGSENGEGLAWQVRGNASRGGKR